MLLRLPPGTSQAQLYEFMAHVAQAQEGSSVETFTSVNSIEEAELMKKLVGEGETSKRFTIVAPRSDGSTLGEAVLALNAACALAEARRDEGGDALLLMDIEPLYKVWSILAEVSEEQQLTERGNKQTNETISKMPKESGAEMWKYIMNKGAASSIRRTYLGCFLQRAARLSKDRGGGSLTILVFARLKNMTKVNRLELEAKLKSVKAMKLDKALREKAIEKLEAQLAELQEEGLGDGVPDDFIEESKAVTDGHVVFSDSAVKDGKLTWSVDLSESVARGITASSVQSRSLDVLRSLRLKAFLMQLESGQVVDSSVKLTGDTEMMKMDTGPLHSLMSQPVGDVLSPEEEAALLVVAMETAERAVELRPLIETALDMLERGRIRSVDDAEARSRVSRVRKWAEAYYHEGADPSKLLADRIEELADDLELKPLERKRLIAAASDSDEDGNGKSVSKADRSLAEDGSFRYASLRKHVDVLNQEMQFLKKVVNRYEDKDLLELFDEMRRRIREEVFASNEKCEVR
eukprot:TRINITY_DN21728_c0_g2_i1.p1 TRINITY_DN21728_c0_g2~~TRINITY_DN21728_c0_g2_i1.p1  ORF type:complete len:521 (+),score=95.72 TRINITY_DN21728_c0_g2_i1:91-1653(+)